jgi:alkylhydroperoxidase/carboxymuconolactone decarboxylase family protein YurZ
MMLSHQDQVQALDPAFGRMAAEVGLHAWSLPQLTMREKTFVFLAADLCTASLGFPLATHVQMAEANGVGLPECIAAIRHLAPYVGYPAAAVALQQLRTDSSAGKGRSVEVQRQTLPEHVFATLNALDEDFAGFVAEQFNQRWNGDDELSARGRAPGSAPHRRSSDRGPGRRGT